MTRSRPVLIANWKMNIPAGGVASFVEAIAARADDRVDLLIAPPFVYLAELRERIDSTALKIGLAGQNCAAEASGAFTGEVAAAMLRDCGASAVIIGHSERRTLFGETDELVRRKLAVAIESGLTPIVCVGEDLETREQGRTDELITRQLDEGLGGVASGDRLFVAYEPVWAIGTGKNATPEIVAEAHRLIRDWLSGQTQLAGSETSVLYGGSVNDTNAAALAAEPLVDGFLVGGASLEPGRLLAIEAALQARSAG